MSNVIFMCFNVQDPAAITYPVQPGQGDMKEEILKEISQRVAKRREYIHM